MKTNFNLIKKTLSPILFALNSFMVGATLDLDNHTITWCWILASFCWGCVTISDYLKRG